MIHLSEQKATVSPIKRPHGLIDPMLLWTFTGSEDTDHPFVVNSLILKELLAP